MKPSLFRYRLLCWPFAVFVLIIGILALHPGQAAAAGSCPSGFTSDFASIIVASIDNSTGASINGAKVTESRSLAGCPNYYGSYVDDSGQPGHSPQTGTTGGTNDITTLYDNCYNPIPYMTQTPPPGDTFNHATLTDTAGTITINSGTQAAFQTALNQLWQGGAVNSASGVLIGLYYNVPVPTTWSLGGGSSVSPTTVGPGQTATFTHFVVNTPGSAPATYTWQVEGIYHASGGSGGSWSGSGLPSGSANSIPANGRDPNPVNTSYKFPPGAANGAKYCQRIDYTNANGPGTGSNNSGSNICVTLNTAGCGGGGCAGGPPSVTGTCSETDASDSGTGNYQTPASAPPDGGTWAQLTPTLPTQTIVNVTDSSGATLVGNGTVGRGNPSNATWTYTPQGANVTVAGNFEEFVRTSKGNHYWVTYATQSNTYNCYAATCSVSVVPSTLPDGTQLPAGGVLAGQPFTVNGSITSYGALDLPQSINGSGLSLTSASPNYPNFASGGISGGPVGVTLAQPTAPGSGSYTITYYPDYWGDADMLGFGSSCTATVNVYQAFALAPTAQVTLSPSVEAPNQVYSTTYVTESGAPVSENVTSELYEITAGGSTIPKANTNNGGPFNPGVTYFYNNYNYQPSMPLEAGDQYCAEIDVPYVAGYVGPAGDIADGTAGTPDKDCPNITNRPYFKVYNGGISAGGDFSSQNPSCNSSGFLGSWNNDSGAQPNFDFGAGSQLHALATGNILGFASNQYTSSTDRSGSPTKLSFANTVNNTGSGTDGVSYSPNLGGQFGGSLCLTDVSSQNNTQSVSASPGNPYNVNPILPGGGTLPEGTSTSIFVTGDAYISGNIVYGSNGSWNVTTPGDTPPAFTLHATGNIYIAPGVTTLYGQYIADGSDSAEPTSGKIYTCANSGGTGPITDTTALFADCNNQLNVYGNFVAKQTNLMRTYGSLRDETPNPSVTGPGTNGATQPFAWLVGRGRGGQASPSLPPGDTCTNIYEPSEPGGPNYTGGRIPPSHGDSFGNGNSYLCVPPSDGVGSGQVQISWTCDNWTGLSTGNPNGCDNTGGPLANCLTIGNYIDPAPWNYPSTFTWSDDQVCSNYTLSFVISTSDPSSSTQYCTSMNDPSDTYGNGVWQEAYLCIQRSQPGATTPGSPHVATPCSNAPAGFTPGSPQTCAAEVFYADPSRYLNNPGSGSGSTGGGENQAQSITSLPPVL